MKTSQKYINDCALREFNYAMRDFNSWHIEPLSEHKLRSCQATVIITPRYFLLRSYNTIVAVINRNTGVKADVLRYVYGYTATSAQHIAKFFIDYDVSLSYPAKMYKYKSI